MNNHTKLKFLLSIGVLSSLLLVVTSIGEVDGRLLSIPAQQLEKLPEWKVDKAFNDLGAIIKNSQMHTDNNGHNLPAEWKRVAWKTNFSMMGLELPPETNPDSRNQTEYIRTYDGACWRWLENDDTNKLTGCRQMTALVANEWQGYFAKDMGALMYMHPTFTNWAKDIQPSDVLHERAQMCSNPEKIWERTYPPHDDRFFNDSQTLRQMIPVGELSDIIEQKKVVDTELYIYLIENHLPQHYKDAIADHILNGYYIDFETGEQKLIHPDGINCDLG